MYRSRAVRYVWDVRDVLGENVQYSDTCIVGCSVLYEGSSVELL